MKKSLMLSVIFFMFFCFTSYSQNKIPTSKAKNYIGKNITVYGVASQVYHSRGGTCFIDMNGDYPDNVFTAVIFKSDLKKFKDIDKYEGKIIDVKGKIKGYEGKPEIILKSEKQIKIITNGK